MGVPPEVIAERRAKGIDLYDEVWQGEYRLSPLPTLEHQRMVTLIAGHLAIHALRRDLGLVFGGANVARPGGWPTDYRCPDVVFLSKGRFAAARNERVEGGPDVVFEVRSPDDESYQKLAFYGSIGIDEVFVVDRDTKRVELFGLRGGELRPVEPDADGWLRSERLRFSIRRVEKEGRPALALLCEGDAEPAVF